MGLVGFAQLTKIPQDVREEGRKSTDGPASSEQRVLTDVGEETGPP